MAPTLDPAALERIDPAAVEIVPRMVAQIANEMNLRARRTGRLAAGHEHRDEARLQLPLGPVEFAELIGVERAVDLLERLQAANGDAYRPAPGLFAAARGD